MTKKKLFIDSRGRVTLPLEFRKEVDSFAVNQKRDGSLHLVPQKSISMTDAQLLEELKKSLKEVKKGKTIPMPKEWIE